MPENVPHVMRKMRAVGEERIVSVVFVFFEKATNEIHAVVLVNVFVRLIGQILRVIAARHVYAHVLIALLVLVQIRQSGHHFLDRPSLPAVVRTEDAHVD